MPEEKGRDRVARLLSGETEVDTSDIAYDFAGFHLGVIAIGSRPRETLRKLAASLQRPVLVIPPDGETAWGWFGGRKKVDPPQLQRLVGEVCPAEIKLAVGEPGKEISGFRLTHRQAKAVMRIAQARPHPFTRYADNAILASLLHDELLTRSLHDLYFGPLTRGRDGGEVARQTLRAYFAAGRNVSSAAQTLDVDRTTVAYRLRKVEYVLGVPLPSVATQLEIALQLYDLERAQQSRERPGASYLPK